MTNDEKIAKLEAEVEALKQAAKPPEPIDWERAVAEHRDRVHQMNERRAANWWIPDKDDLAKMAAAVTPADCADLASHGTIPTRSVAGISGTLSSVHPNAGLAGSHKGTGWVEPRPLGPPPGVAAADRLMDAADARDRHELVMQEARRLAMQKVAEQK
jgi:hypothetical protein